MDTVASAVDTVALGLAVVGVINGVRLLKEATESKNWWGFIFFMSAVAAGTFFGFLGWFGTTVQTGFLYGLSSSGAYRLLEKNGGN